MKKQKTFLIAVIAFLALVTIRSLYYVGIQNNILNVVMVSFVAVFIAVMYIVKFLSKSKDTAVLPVGKNIWAGVFAGLSAVALVVDGFYHIFTISDLERVYNDLIEPRSQTIMTVIFAIRSLFGFGFAIVLILFAMSCFKGNKTIGKNNILISLPVFWGCIRLSEIAFVDGYWVTSVTRGVDIIGIVFLVFSLFSIAKMQSDMHESRDFVKFTTRVCICIPIVLVSSLFGLFDALSGTLKCNMFSYIGEFCLALFVFFILKVTTSVELSECEKNNNSFSKMVFDVLDIAVSSLTCLCVLFTIFFRVSTVQGPSMEDTLHDKDRLLMYSFMYTPKNNDIIVINPLESLFKARGSKVEEKKRIVKRVIAVEGQTLRIDFDSQKVYVDGKEIKESYRFTDMKKPTKYEIATKYYGDIPEKIPKGYVFVMGDNRGASTDSRYSEIGLIPVEKILGKAIFRFWPLDSIKKF